MKLEGSSREEGMHGTVTLPLLRIAKICNSPQLDASIHKVLLLATVSRTTVYLEVPEQNLSRRGVTFMAETLEVNAVLEALELLCNSISLCKLFMNTHRLK